MKPEFRHDFAKLMRLPPYVLSEVTSLRHAARRAGEDVIDLGMGNPDLATPPHVVEKIAEAAHNSKNHRYSASGGIPNLRSAICDLRFANGTRDATRFLWIRLKRRWL